VHARFNNKKARRDDDRHAALIFALLSKRKTFGS